MAVCVCVCPSRVLWPVPHRMRRAQQVIDQQRASATSPRRYHWPGVEIDGLTDFHWCDMPLALSPPQHAAHTHKKRKSFFCVCVCVCVFRCVYQTVLIPPPFSSKGWSLLAAQRGGPLQRFKLGKNIGTVWTTLSSGSSVAENHRVDERAQFVSLFFFFFFFSRLLVLRIVSSSLDPEIARCSN